MASLPPKQKVVLRPQLSINKLGEFVSATQTRRETILRDQKFPKPGGGGGSYYDEACKAIVRYLTEGQDLEILVHALTKLDKRKPKTPQATTMIADNVAALQAFIRLIPQLRFPEGAELISGLPNEFVEATTEVEGVKVKIRPEVLLRFTHKRKPKIGVIKLHFSRNFSFNDKNAPQMAALLEHCLRASPLGKNEDVHTQSCLLIDVFTEQVTGSPSTFRTAIKEVGACCRAIAAMWPGISK